MVLMSCPIRYRGGGSAYATSPGRSLATVVMNGYPHNGLAFDEWSAHQIQ